MTTSKLPAYAFPGGYPIYYLDPHGEVACADCASKESVHWNYSGIYWEGPAIECDGCSKLIESAYGDTE